MTLPLVVLAKAPVAGQVKTRLAATIGEARALAVYQALLAHTAAVADTWPGPVTVCGTGDRRALAASPLGRFRATRQRGDNLGARLRAALADHGDRALLIGTDCPGLALSHLAEITRLLEDRPVALGPATDGGYWCLATTVSVAADRCCRGSLPWSTPQLLAATTADLDADGIAWALGPELADLDDGDDLAQATAAGLLRIPGG